MKNATEGFIATIAVVLLAMGTLAFSLATISSAAAFEDASYRRELRNETRLDATGCLDTISLMVEKDYFLSGDVKLPEFNCTAKVMNDFRGGVSITVSAEIDTVDEGTSTEIHL